ncbi:DNA-binding ferritin-like protein (Dps family) [Paenisporosarcina quisquiliarum]|nr:DNA-binding ferritin-like protein (Dps family) [Paenisporosarcina quisquiliarum]
MMEMFKKLIGNKKEYKVMMARVEVLPEDYKFVFKKIQNYMWNFSAGNGMDMLHIQYELIDLFEAGAADGRQVLEITGNDVASFADELVANAKTYVAKYREDLNLSIMKQLGKK